MTNWHPLFPGLHFSDVGSCLVPMLQRGNEKARTVKSVNYFWALMKDAKKLPTNFVGA